MDSHGLTCREPALPNSKEASIGGSFGALAGHGAPLPLTSASSNSAAAIARSRAARSSLAVSRVSSIPSIGIADHLGVRNAAIGAHFCGYVIRIALARTFIEVSADREIAVMRKPTGRLNVELAPAREVVDKHHAWKEARTRRFGPRTIGSMPE